MRSELCIELPTVCRRVTKEWFAYLRRGLSRNLPNDGIARGQALVGVKHQLDNLRPFVAGIGAKGPWVASPFS